MSRKVPSIGIGPAHTPRNAFDLSERSLYTQCAGMLTPVYIKELNPHDHLSLDIRSELQAQTLKGRAFVGMKQHMAAFFVPYKYLWSYWQSFITGLSLNNTIKSSGLHFGNNVGMSTKVPTFRPLELYKALVTSAVSPGNDDCCYPFLPSYVRLCDLLGYGNVAYFADKTTADDKIDVSQTYESSVFRWAAYQKIYQDHFLDDRFEKRDVTTYQLDKFMTGPNQPASLVETKGENIGLFYPRYAKYAKDYLNNFQQSPLFVDSVSNTIKTFVGTSPTSDSSLYGRGPAYNPYQQADTIATTIWNGAASTETILSAAQIRNLFALDKMAQISSRAAKTYTAQMRAHYGVNVDGEEHVSLYCGGYSNSLDSQAVIATSSGDSTSFGQQGAFIDNVAGDHINFDAKDFGVFMVLSWIVPDARWSAVGVDPFNSKLYKEDFYHPETADLGMQPITTRNYRLLFNSAPPSSNVKCSYSDKDKVVGWTERYAEYKSSFDRLHGEFIPVEDIVSGGSSSGYPEGAPIGSLSFLTTHMDSFSKNLVKTPAAGGGFKDSLEFAPLSWKMICVSPSCLDDVVDVKYNGHQMTDPFRVDTHFKCTIVRDMSVSGLPWL